MPSRRMRASDRCSAPKKSSSLGGASGTGDSITYVARVLVEGRRKTIPLADFTSISVQEKLRRGGPYHVIVIHGRTKTIHFGAGLDRQALLDVIPLILAGSGS